jgi:hypothetical protein
VIRVLAFAAVLAAPAWSVVTAQSAHSQSLGAQSVAAPHRRAAAPVGEAPAVLPGGDGTIGATVAPDGDRPVVDGQGLDLSGGGLPRSPDLDLGPDSGQPADALPLSRFAGANAKSPPDKGGFDIWEMINRVRSGGLPEPASWALMLLGFGMIGGALRGFVVANRRLARLQPEDTDEPADP